MVGGSIPCSSASTGGDRLDGAGGAEEMAVMDFVELTASR